MLNENSKNRAVLIVGVTSGIGRALCKYLLSEGYYVIGVGRDKNKISSLSNELVNYQAFLVLKSLDCSIEDEVFDFAKSLRIQGFKLIGIIHTAGITTTIPVKMVNSAKFDELMRNNVFTFFNVVSKFTHKDFIIKETGMSIVTFSSVMALVGESGKSLYAATKGALLSSVKSLAVELASKEIRVNSISPGVVETPMVRNGYYAQNQDSYQKITEKHILGLGKESDIISLIEFLISKKSRWITGSNFTIDGGYTAI